MSSAPYGVRLLVGVAATAVEETMRLPQTILTYPMTVASTFAHLVMKVQQDIADLVIKGDSTLENIFPPKDEQPEWATFDEDDEATAPESPAARRTEGRFALYSMPDVGVDATEDTADDDDDAPEPEPVDKPEIVDAIDYDSLTLAQVRARLQHLSVGELEDLLAYEEAGKGRAPFQTLLANRITRASAK